MKALVARALVIAAGEEGVREQGGPNRGGRVEEYLSSVGLGPGNPWCMAFCYWALAQAAEQIKVRFEFLRSGKCEYVRVWAKGEGILRERPELGDVFLYAPKGYAKHTGFVTKVVDGRYHTVEGNTNLAGSREGVGVFLRDRPIAPEYRFVRWELLVDEGDEAPVYYWVQGGRTIAEVPVVGGRAMVPVRRWGEWLGFDVTWDADRQSVLFNGEEVPVELALSNGVARCRIRDLANYSGLALQVDTAKRTITAVNRA